MAMIPLLTAACIGQPATASRTPGEPGAAGPTTDPRSSVPSTYGEPPDITALPTVDDAEQVARAILAYGEEHRDEFGGVYIDRDLNVVVALFTGNLDSHEAALRSRLGQGAVFEVVEARLTEAALIALQERIIADHDELRVLGIFVVDAGTDLARGTVRLGISTEREDAAEVIRSRYGTGVEAVVIDPTGAYLKPRGTIVLTVVDENGKPLEAFIGWNPLFAEIPLDALALYTDPQTGRLVLDDALPGPWSLSAGRDGYRSGSTEVDLPPGGSVEARIVLEKGGR